MKTKVIIRKDKYGVFAIFPYIVGSRSPKNVLCYAHDGQHFSADYVELMYNSSPAGEEEKNELLRELNSLGYTDLLVMQKANIAKVYNQF